jgi:ribonuclease P protein component
MLPRSQRLTRTLFSRIGKSARRARGTSLQLLYLKAPDFRVSVVVSKKVAKSAVMRNGVRRKVYAVFAELSKKGDIPQGHFVVLSSPALPSLSYGEIMREVLLLITPLLSHNSRPR